MVKTTSSSFLEWDRSDSESRTEIPSVRSWPDHLGQPLGQHRGHALEGLVEQQQPGAAHEGPGQGRQLLLAAGELQPLALPERATSGMSW